jgi:hypothetical protein
MLTMILSDDSPLNRIPPLPDVLLVQLLDGVRYSIAMADLSYVRLESSLAAVFEPEPKPYRISTAAFLDVWSFVDAINRLRNLFERTVRQKVIPQVRVFIDATETYRDLRNDIQHLETELRKKERPPVPGTPATWGTLACLAPTDDPRAARFGVLVPGTRSYATANFGLADRPYPTRPVDSITLTAHGKQVCLTDTHGALERVTRAIEKTLPSGTHPVVADFLLTGGTPYEVSAEPMAQGASGSGERQSVTAPESSAGSLQSREADLA